MRDMPLPQMRRNTIAVMHSCSADGQAPWYGSAAWSFIIASHSLPGISICRPMKNTLSGNEGRGFMKILVDAKTDTVIGVHMIGPDCAEIMQVSHALSCSACCVHTAYYTYNTVYKETHMMWMRTKLALQAPAGCGELLDMCMSLICVCSHLELCRYCVMCGIMCCSTATVVQSDIMLHWSTLTLASCFRHSSYGIATYRALLLLSRWVLRRSN